MTMIGLVGVQMEVMDDRNSGHSRGGRMSGDAGALPEYKVML